MTEKPEFIDNRSLTMADALRSLAARRGPDLAPLDVATAYLNLGGYEEIADMLESRTHLRLLLGAEPRSAFDENDGGEIRGLGVRGGLDALEAGLSGDRDALPFDAATAESVLRLAAFLRRDTVAVRRFTERFLHAKVYVFRDEAVLAGSHNLTRAGLRHNLEVSVANYSSSGCNRAGAWFDELWQDAEEYRERLIEILAARETRVWQPHDIYLRALLELYRDELALLSDDDDYTPGQPGAVSLAGFQRHGFQRARAIIERWDGVIVGDGVGLGKSFVGSALLDHYVKQEGLRALVLVPAALRDSFWRRHIDQLQIPATVLSYQELASEPQLGGAGEPRLNVDKDAYRFVLVDEAHAFRNPGTDQYRALSRLMGGSRKKLCLMTATPVNNGVFDLYHQIMLFARHTARFAAIGIPNLTEYFKTTTETATAESAAMFGLMDAISVRRTRRFIKSHYSNDTINGEPIRFPNPKLRTVRYDLDAIHPGLFERIAAGVDALTMARYRPDDYRLDGEVDTRARTLAGILRTQLLKRFESSVEAFRRTVDKLTDGNQRFLDALDRGQVLGSTVTDQDSDEDDPALGVAEAGARPISEYRAIELRRDVEADLAVLASFAAEVAAVRHDDDPKLAELARILTDDLGPEKAIVFSLYADTIDWIEQAMRDDETNGGTRFGTRRFVSITGTSTATAKQRLERVRQFCPRTTAEVYGAEPVAPADEKDLLLTTDVLAEGQNLQQARYIVNYDMPWNPMRLVQRNGRIDRIGSPYADQNVYLYNLFPAGDLDRILRLYETLLRKIGAANLTVGMESPVFEDVAAAERTFTGVAEQIRGIADEEIGVLDAAEAKLDAFSGEEFRMELRTALAAHRLAELDAIPHGAGSGFIDERLPADTTGVFFAVRLLLGARSRPDDRRDQRAWHYVDLADPDHPLTDELEILDRVRCSPGAARILPDGSAPMLYDLWARVQAAIIDQHNQRLDPAVAAAQVPASHLWAIDLLAAQTNALVATGKPVDEIDAAAAALEVDRGPAVQRMLNRPRQLAADGEMSAAEAAREVLEIVARQGLRPVEADEAGVVELTPERVRLVCYQVVAG